MSLSAFPPTRLEALGGVELCARSRPGAVAASAGQGSRRSQRRLLDLQAAPSASVWEPRLSRHRTSLPLPTLCTRRGGR